MVTPQPVAKDIVLEHLARVLASTGFRDAERSSAILRFIVERTLEGQAERLKEYTVGAEALGRGVAFDPRTDPIVRAEASRLRTRLDRYYATDGNADAVLIQLPKGTYVPRFDSRLRPRARWLPRWSPRVAWIGAGSLATIAAFTMGAWVTRPASRSSGPRAESFEVRLQSAGVLGSEVGTDVVITPDGSRVIFVSTDSTGHTRLRVKAFDVMPASDLPGTEGARGPFLSPDGQGVGFWANRQLKKTSIAGGSPTVLCEALDLLGASWGEDGLIVAALDASGQLWQLPAGGGTPTPILDLSADRVAPRWPQLLPGGKRVLYTALSALGADRANIEVASMSDGRRTVLVRGGTHGRYVAPGYLTYVNQGTLYAVRVDLDRLEVHGSAIPIVDEVAYSSNFGYAQADLSASGTLAYRRAGPLIVVMRDSTGRDATLIDTPGRYVWPALSPDGRRLALSAIESGVRSTSIFENLNEHPTRTAPPTVGVGAAAWTRDGRFLVGSDSGGLSWLSANGGAPHRLIDTELPAVAWSFGPGGNLAFHVMNTTTALDLWTTTITESDTSLSAGRSEPLLQSTSYEAYPSFSPDGRWLAFMSNESGEWEVYVRAVPDNGTRVLVSRSGGHVPRWSPAPARRELFFSTDDQRLMVAAYTIQNGKFVAAQPRQWTSGRLGDTGVFPNYDVTADGRRVVALIPAGGPQSEGSSENHVTLRFNFVDELRQRLPK